MRKDSLKKRAGATKTNGVKLKQDVKEMDYCNQRTRFPERSTALKTKASV
jgi:hypothetical protein